MALQKFAVARLPLAKGSPLCREVLVKVDEQEPPVEGAPFKKRKLSQQRGGDEYDVEGKEALLVAHLDKFVQADQLKAFFQERAGPVTDVKLTRNTKDLQSADCQLLGIQNTTSLARISFFNPSDLSSAIQVSAKNILSSKRGAAIQAADSSVSMPTPPSFNERLSSRLKRYRDREELKKEVDVTLQRFETERKAAARLQEEQASPENDDDFTLVTRSGGTAGNISVKSAPRVAAVVSAGKFGTTEAVAATDAPLAATNVARRKRKKGGRGGVVSDFYSFQVKQKQKEEIASKRRTRAEDEKSIDRLRGNKVFKKLASVV